MNEESNSKPTVLSVDSVHHSHTAEEVNLWVLQTFSRDWFTDALSEINASSNQNSRRREIVFAVCFAESYLFEWVRDDVLQHNYEELHRYFPVGCWRGIKDRWKQVLAKLAKDGRIKKSPDFGLPYWQAFMQLVDFRNGLVHASASRPDSMAQEEKQRPKPTADILNNLQPGWPTNTVKELVLQLHDAVGTIPPQWLRSPSS